MQQKKSVMDSYDELFESSQQIIEDSNLVISGNFDTLKRRILYTVTNQSIDLKICNLKAFNRLKEFP